MAEMKGVSVIVPVCDTLPYLSACVRSILCQTYRNLDIILVDDGSTDGSGKLCDEFAGADPRVRVLHQTNQGLSAARNNGAAAARFDWITFVDSDDTLDPRCIELHARAVTESGASCSFARTDRVRTGETSAPLTGTPETACWDRDRIYTELFLSARANWTAYNKLAPRQWYLDCPFPVGHCYEDLRQTFPMLTRARTGVWIDAVLYHYTMRGNSITGRKRTSFRQCVDYEQSVRYILRGYGDPAGKRFREFTVMFTRECMALYTTARRCSTEDPEELRRLAEIEKQTVEWVRSYGAEAVSCPGAPASLTLRVRLFRFSPLLYEKLYYIALKLRGRELG